MLVLEMFLNLLLVSMAALSGLASADGDVYPACICKPDGHLATCSFMDLARVPVCLPGENVTELYLDNNRIQEITANQLQPFKSLRLLSAERNSISSLPDDLFQYTTRLREIYLGRNWISRFSPATFLYLENLQKLDLSSNHIFSVPPLTFRVQSKLLELDLSNNWLRMLPAISLPRLLRVLRLNENQLFSVPNKWPESLEELDLSNNRLQRVDVLALQQLPALRELRLEGNLWHCSCEATGALAELVARRNFLEDMDDPMLCASPPELKNSQLMDVLRHCYAGPSSSASPTTVLHSSSLMPMTATNTIDVPFNPAYNHAKDTTEVPFKPAYNHAKVTLTLSLIILVSICACIVAVLLVRKIYVMCREKRFCIKHDGEKLTSDEESVM